MFSTVLIANRGEIALRIARTCRELGIRTVAVYSTADQDAPVVRFADEAVHIGPAAPRRSYLNAAAIVEAARKTGAEAIHPGYGFLSEDPDFAEICAAEGLTFIGPPPAVLARLGDKARAREVMADAGLPVLPGGNRTVDTVAEAVERASSVGFPLIIKAAAGGGGRGMAVVREPHDLPRIYAEVRATGQAVFGDSRVYLERYLDGARHVEVQVLADSHGGVVHLGERDCSVQRRRQKLVEETPAPGLAPKTAASLHEAAVRGVRATGYVGAGTFEFLVTGDGEFYFMEINCRIQVEHPVTEMVTGVDLIGEQLRVAAGYPLTLTQADVQPRGASIECRVNAEDPRRGFLPTAGTVTTFRAPGGPFTRVDTHLEAGQRVTADYDPMLAKVVVWAQDRRQAIARMQRALSELAVEGPGVQTTVPFLTEVLAHPRFLDGKHTTTLVDEMTAQA
ncbi:acetyl-CoA carboxylase biotin carboxylase subunit [Paractinoplanes ferrugineus]|uniref:biotin carboxylase n=1 Tax=Paractinoplanes ferrugineus TaxID=113564 RepID=A0A919MGC1_9ACTN|nr:acetyl-CoA carboxylase biotin carboxylase subunit [Actinoplanes ferrugineus]GIE13699.1 acetyl-CoA carboxylase biotin carboxylase subunit [Actinoplanes ferrugineus]